VYRPGRVILLGEDATPELPRDLSGRSGNPLLAAILPLAHSGGRLRATGAHLPVAGVTRRS
jgi:hypothetical protein